MSTAEVIDFYNAKQGVNMANLKKGYIAITRSVRKAEWAKCAIKRTLWENILIDACYKNRTVNFKGVEWDLLRGQLVTTREILASQIYVDGKPVSALTIRRALEFFEKNGMISKSGNRLGTVITITNYDVYQSYFCDQSNDQRNDQPCDQNKANNSNGLNGANDQPHDQSNDQRNDQQNNKVLEQESNNKKHMSSGDDVQPSEEKTKIDFDLIKNAYNDAVDGEVFPSVRLINNKRKTAIKKLISQLENPTVNGLIDYFYDFAEKSPDWMRGKTKINFIADFDYIVRPSTYLKVLEGTL